jgi:prepilin peptidase CpaA
VTGLTRATSLSCEAEDRLLLKRQRSCARDAGVAALAIGAGAVVSAGFVWSNQEAPLPTLVWAAAFLFLVVEEDLRRRRIPNAVTLPGLLLALGLGLWSQGWLGGVAALLGAGVAFVLLFPVFLLRGIGAGDVKAVMCIGALWGPLALLGSLWWMLLIGGLVAIAMAGARGVLIETAQRWASSAWVSLATRRWTYFAPAPGSPAAAGIPFGLAIALGAWAYRSWGIPWI